MDTNLSINKIIVHILDNNMNMPVLSNAEHPDDREIGEFVGKHIVKILNDDNLKTGYFIDEDNRVKELCQSMAYNVNEFENITVELAGILYGIMQKNPDIPSADLICCLFDIDGIPHVALLKLNYRESYIHHVDSGSSGVVNSIVKQKTALPAENQKVDEAAIINLSNLDIKLIEKKYEINGERSFYLSEMFLKCNTNMSDKQKVKAFKKALDSFNKKYYSEDFTKSADIKNAVAECLEENEVIDVARVGEKVFRRNPDMKDAYIEHMEKAGLKDEAIEADEETAEKVFKKHKIKTDTGIEINLPVDYYKDKEKLEFINNFDGTISILIKNISKITDV